MTKLKIPGIILVVSTFIGYFLKENKINSFITNTILIISAITSVYLIFQLVRIYFFKKNN